MLALAELSTSPSPTWDAGTPCNKRRALAAKELAAKSEKVGRKEELECRVALKCLKQARKKLRKS